MDREIAQQLQALEYDPRQSLWTAFSRVVALAPDEPALISDDLRLTYAEVAKSAENIASRLLSKWLQPGGRVALISQRSADAILAMLGILRAGGVFIPLDPAYASEQLSYVLSHAAPGLILHDFASAKLVADLAKGGGQEVLEIGAACAEFPAADFPARVGSDTAYIIYTSGSTGRPKGVVVPQRALARIAFAQGELTLPPGELMLHSSTIAADGCGVEIWPPLLTGGAVLVVPGPKPSLDLLSAAIRRHRPTAASFYTGIFHLLVEHRLEDLGSFRRMAAGGDVMSAAHARLLLDRWPEIRLFNLYGPSETTVYAAMHQVRQAELAGGTIPIGRAEAHGDCIVLADDLTECTDGEVGQLAITGLGLADGYLDQPEQTAAQFIADPRKGHDGRAYLTGDMVRRRPDGTLEFLGRSDRQVKIGGRRIELDEVEHVMRQHPAVADVAVVLANGAAGKMILAFAKPVAGLPANERQFLREVMDDLRRELPEGMLPRKVRLLADLPLTANGKVDRQGLAAMAREPDPRPEPSEHRTAPASSDWILRTITEVWDQILHCGPIPPDATFFEAGGTSLQLLDAHAILQSRLGVEFDVTLMFETPRAAELARRLAELGPKRGEALATDKAAQSRTALGDVAIIAYAGRVAGAGSIDQLWQHIGQGDNLIRPIPPDQIEDNFTPEQRMSPNYVAVRPWLDDVDMFDAPFFGMYPREAALTDPQGRVFLEICHEVLERAGHDPQRFLGRIGVWAGCSFSTYLVRNILADRKVALDVLTGLQISHYPEMTGNLSDSLATRIAYRLNLRGPAMTVATACSTSLTAIAQAVLGLRAGQCDFALAGGVSITFPQGRGYLCQEGGMVSPDGVCRPFDKDAGGTVFGHGAGIIALRRLEDALADGDQVLAIIRGIGINNDGSDKISYTAPSVTGQVDAIRMAWADAGLTPGDADYIECHGTATPLGDPIEMRSLTLASGAGRGAESCAIGSIKGNLGHLDAAAGVMGVIKAAQVLSRRMIPPVANFRSLNPRIDLSGTPFRVPKALEPWQGQGPMRAGVSGFGVGGTNVHLALEEAPPRVRKPQIDQVQILPLAARSPAALEAMRDNLAAALEAEDAPELADIAFTLQEGRGLYPWRMAVAARNKAEAAVQLRKTVRPVAATGDKTPRIAFMFPGQGAQYPGMGAGLYQDEPEFAHWIDQGAVLLRPLLGLDLNDLLARAEHSDTEAARLLRDTRLTQPALYLVQYALARLWLSRGVEPAAMIGHSVGEFAVAALSGVFSFEDGLRLIARRGQLMQEQPPGGMLSVRATMAELAPHLDGCLDHAASNAPKLQVLAGPTEAIAALANKLQAAGIASTPLHTSHAFHSRMMDPVCAALAVEFKGLQLRGPVIPWVSTVTGDWITEEAATSPEYWAGQARRAVDFEKAIRKLAEAGPVTLLECGPGAVLSAFAGQTLPRDGGHLILQSLPDHTASEPDAVIMARSFGRLWAAGHPANWKKIGPRGQSRVVLPTYPFQRKRHWIDLPLGEAVAEPLKQAPAPVLETPIGRDDMPTAAPTPDRKPRLISELLATLRDLSGEDLGPDDSNATFLELGFDSLFLGQFTQKLAQEHGCTLTFRQLLSDYPSVEVLAGYLDETLPAETPKAAAIAVPVSSIPPAVAPQQVVTAPLTSTPLGQGASQPPISAPLASDGVAAVVQAQLQAMQNIFAGQLAALGQPGVISSTEAVQAPPPTPPAANSVKPQAAAVTAPIIMREADPVTAKPAFSIGRATNAGGGDLTPKQLAFARDLSQRYAAKFPKTREWTQKYRAVMADPRTVAGFRQEWKDMVFPVVADRAKGSRIHDIDGNSFVDYVNGFGTTAFGHAPDFVNEAVAQQLTRGYAIGPQSDLAGETAERFARLVGHERVTFCNTGSEAVMAAMRLARAVTGREKVVVFSNDYHGQFDEVLVKGRGRGDSPDALPIAPGIPRSGLSNMIVLPWGGDAALSWLRENAGSVAAVLVEPVQSRHPEMRPAEFVRTLRALTEASGTALVMDEVVTGFRTGPRGMQGNWGIDADMATYGKVIGGGMPIGMLAGKRRFMDALDGGFWSYGDTSAPETAPTFFAGTFVRHPLVLAAVRATLDHIEAHGPELWDRTAARMGELADSLNARLARDGLPRLIEGYSSWFVLNLPNHDANATLLWPLMRLEGIHLQVGYAAIGTTAHSEADFQAFDGAFNRALDELQSVGIMAGDEAAMAAPKPVNATVAKVEERAISGPFPLTEVQREIWLTSQLSDEASCSFNESASLVMRGALDEPALGRALTQLIARHDGLRQVFAPNGESFRILPAFAPEVIRHDLTTTPDPEAALAEILRADSAQPIDLINGPALRLMLVRRGTEDHILVVNAHHIICDGWSMNLVFGDLAQLYAAEHEGRVADLPPAPSFAAHATRAATLPEPEETAAWWRAVHAQPADLPDLPLDHPRGAWRSFKGATYTAHIPADLVKSARKAGAKHGCTLFATLFGSLSLTLSRLTGADDLVIGVPTAGQMLLEDQGLVGHCVNFLPIRTQIDRHESAASFLSRTGRTVLQAFEHSDYTYGTMVRALKLKRGLDRLPLTEVQFNLEKIAGGMEMGGLQVSAHPNPKTAVNFDLFFNMVESREGLRVDVDYNADLYEQATIARWLGHLQTLLGGLSASDAGPVGLLPVCSEVETEHLVKGLNATARPVSALLPATILAQPAERVALDDGSEQMTYGTLARRSAQYAAAIATALPGKGERVGILMRRSADLVAAILGVMRAGHTFVPLDPGHPAVRLNAVLDAARVGLVLHDPDMPEAVTEGRKLLASTGLPAVDLDNLPQINTQITLEDSAYILFTSGSTGQPKGVEVGHGALANLITSICDEPGIGADSSLLAVTTISFDISLLELFAPLAVGGRVVIAAHEDVLDGFRLVTRLNKGDITHMQATPTLWSMLLEAGLKPMPGLVLFCGGEPLSADLAAQLTAGGAALWNLYGPTETTIWSSLEAVKTGARVTIGHPIANTELHVLGPMDEILPPGAVGELNIGGFGLAKGYFDRPDLTETAFRPVELGGSKRRLYRSGDLARRMPDGRIEVLGRRDAQIKLRGFRIELEDVEAALRAIPGVDSAAVALRPSPRGGDQLVGYVVGRQSPSVEEMAQAMAVRLPGYMVPSAWVTLSELPRTANGKLDRRALPAPDALASVTPLRSEPRTETERYLLRIWTEVLALEAIGTRESLYALGIDSLSVFRIAARLMDDGRNVMASDLMKHPSIEALAAWMDARDTAPPTAPARPSLAAYRNGAKRGA